MKTKYIHLVFAILLASSMFTGSLFHDVSIAGAQSSHIWSDPVNLSNSGGASESMVIVDTLGVIHALWFDQYDGYKYSQSTDGKEWTKPKNANYPFISKVTDPKLENSHPVLVAVPRGFIQVFWQNKEGTLKFAQAHSGNLGDPSAWGYQYQMSAGVLAYGAAVDPQGVLHVAYIRNINSDLGPAGVYYVRSLDEGRSWSVERLLYESQYFRAVRPDAAHIRVITSSEGGGEKVFVTWDNTSLKRIFMSASTDSGSNWVGVVQLKGPEDTGGYNMPYNVNMNITGENVLLIWEVGEPGSSQCTLYGQWSTDGGSTWDAPNVILGDRSICPHGVDILMKENNSIIALLRYQQGNPSLIAWNGTEWSEPQAQNELSYFANPITNETILFGCQNYFVTGKTFFLIGCDQGSGGDIWLTSRMLDSASDWSFSTSLWSPVALLTSATQTISSLVYVADGEYLHAFWAQSSITDTSSSSGAIYYSRWDGSQWSPAQGIITGLIDSVEKLSAILNKRQGRLFLVWSSKNNGDLLFSWANVSLMNIASEWNTPSDLPSPAQRMSSPDILVDASGRIVVVYSVPFNENRGVYMVQSTDNGLTWPEPVRIFDAVSAGWEMVNDPKIAIGGDGRLHVLFTRFSGLGARSEGLYYSQSTDGGITWNDPEVVGTGVVDWSDIVSSDGQTIHRLWQVEKNSVVANLYQVSRDGGASWGIPNDITGTSDVTIPVTMVVSESGELHVLQLTTKDSPEYLKEYDLGIKDWRWNSDQWDSQPSQTIKIKGGKVDHSFASGISSNGFISVSVIAAYFDMNGDYKNEIYTTDRFLNSSGVSETSLAPVIPTSINAPISTQFPSLQPSQPSISSTLDPALTEEASSAFVWKMVGIFLALSMLGLVVFIFLRRTGPRDQN